MAEFVTFTIQTTVESHIRLNPKALESRAVPELKDFCPEARLQLWDLKAGTWVLYAPTRTQEVTAHLCRQFHLECQGVAMDLVLEFWD